MHIPRWFQCTSCSPSDFTPTRFQQRTELRRSAYIDSSPLYHVRNVHTPLLLVHGDKDETVPISQSLEFFNALRRLGDRPVVLLQYAGEGHVFKEPRNIRDLTHEQAEFFDYLLKGGPAPEWWGSGESGCQAPATY